MSLPDPNKRGIRKPRMIGAHVAKRKQPDHLAGVVRDVKSASEHFWRKRGGVPQVNHGGFGR